MYVYLLVCACINICIIDARVWRASRLVREDLAAMRTGIVGEVGIVSLRIGAHKVPNR